MTYSSTAFGVPPESGPSTTPEIIRGFSIAVLSEEKNGASPTVGLMVMDPSDPPKHVTSTGVAVKSGIGLTVTLTLEVLDPQLFVPVTLTEPELEPKSTETLFVPAPEVIDAPDGTDQL